MSNILEKINSKEYDFLRYNKDLQNISYLVLSGSHGYGTNNENSDIDLRGALRENEKYFYGLNTFEQFEDLESDTVIYSLKKFVQLSMQCNPNTIELLGVDDDSIVQMDNVGKYMRDNQDMFLSKKAIKSFGNYSNAQLRRLQNALCHDSLQEADRLKHLKNSLEGQMDHINRNYKSFGENALKIYVDETKNELCFDVDLKKYPIGDFVSIYSELSNTLKTYNKLNHRNNKKDDAHLYKHAMHLIRLLITGTDILNGKGIITKRKDEHKLLMDIRNGLYTFDEIFKITDDMNRLFEESAKTTKLPDDVDYTKIEDFLIKAYTNKF